MGQLDITKIPGVMRSNKWVNGAKLMEKWFAGPPNNSPASGIPSADIITLDWVLRYPRAKAVYDAMIKEKAWLNPAAQKEIIAMLKLKGLLGAMTKTFGTPKLHVPIIDSDAVQFRKVGSTWDMAFGDMDDLRAALANFVFKVIVVGEVEPLREGEKKILMGRYQVTISEVGIYVRDSYDFNDAPGEDQELGNWDFEDNSVGRTALNGGETVRNSDFRKWRDANKRGGDFLVFSNIEYIKLDPPDSFVFKK